MSPVCLAATEMYSGGEHRGNWHPRAICLSFVAVRDSARDLCICDLGVMLGKVGIVDARTHWRSLRGRGRPGLQRWGAEGR